MNDDTLPPIDYTNVEEHFPLGKKYKDRFTGTKGYGAAHTFHHNGCISIQLEKQRESGQKYKDSLDEIHLNRVDERVELGINRHPLLNRLARNEHTGIEGLITHVSVSLEGFTHVLVRPAGNDDDKPKPLINFSIEEIGIKHENNWVDPKILMTAKQVRAERPSPNFETPHADTIIGGR